MANSSNLWELPEVLVFHIVSFISGPTERAHVVCHQLALLCKSATIALLKNETSPLWSAILKSDYGAQLNERSDKRSSKRLKQSHLQRVCDAHNMTRDNAEIAYYYLSELCTRGLTRKKLASIIVEYGAQKRINRLTTTGGTFLVECCRARNVKESTILKCVEELVENNGAFVNISASEQPPKKLTALCVASARGMPTVVKYLLLNGADPSIKSTGRFRLYSKPRKTVTYNDATPLEFAERIALAEKEEGVNDSDLKDLMKVISLLKKASPVDRPDKEPTDSPL